MEVSFNDIEIGKKYTSAGRTLIEADIVNFAGLTGDFNPLHMDEKWVRENTNFPSRIAHGLLVAYPGPDFSAFMSGDSKINTVYLFSACTVPE